MPYANTSPVARDRGGRLAPSSRTTEPPPHNLEAELSTLGGLILDNRAWTDVSAIVQESDFFDERHRIMFNAIRAQMAAGKPTDIVTLLDELERTGLLEDAGGAPWIGQTARDTPSAANILHYARIVRRKSLERQRQVAIAADDHHKAAAITAGIDRLETSSLNRPRLISIQELCSTPPAEHWLIKGYVPIDSIGTAFGDPEGGKSFVLIDLACHVATGRPWRGMPVKQGPVVYVAGEGRNGLAKRFKAWFEPHGEELRNIYLLTTPTQLTDPASIATLIEEIKALPIPPVLIEIDTVNRNFGPGDENSTGDMTLAVAGMDALRTATGATVLGAHHCGHNEKSRGRGSSVLRASLDFEYSVEKFDKTVQIRCTKAKDFDHPPPMAWTFEPQVLPWCDEEGAPINSAVLMPTETVGRQSSAPTGKHERLAFTLLDAHFQEPVQPVQTDFVPAGVPVTEWRTEFYGTMPEASSNTNKQTWNRAQAALVAKNIVVLAGINDTLAWPVHRYKTVQNGTCTGDVPVQTVHTPIGVYRCTDPVPVSDEPENDNAGPGYGDSLVDDFSRFEPVASATPETGVPTSLSDNAPVIASQAVTVPPPRITCVECSEFRSESAGCKHSRGVIPDLSKPPCQGAHFRPKGGQS